MRIDDREGLNFFINMEVDGAVKELEKLVHHKITPRDL
jgi:hypothetical protein